MTTSLADWKGVPAPTVTLIEGRFVRLENSTPPATAMTCSTPCKAPARIRSCGTICLTAHSPSAPPSTPG